MLKLIQLLTLLATFLLITPGLFAAEVIEWDDLMPAEDLAAMKAVPDQSIDHSSSSAAAQRLPDVFFSNRVVPEMNNKAVRIAGYVVPLETDAENAIIEFFLVPYFGACIHVPPPPPNQIIHVTLAQGLKTEEIWMPFWVEGVLTTESMNNDVAESSYRLKATSIELYEE